MSLFYLFFPPFPLVNYGTYLSFFFFFLIDVTLSIDGFIAKVAVWLTCHVSPIEQNHPVIVLKVENPEFGFSSKFSSPFHRVLFLFFLNRTRWVNM